MYCMAWIVITAMMVSSTIAAGLDERCTRNSNCETPNSFCKVVSPSCGAGVCSCMPGFTLEGTVCRRAVYLNGKCTPGVDKCVGDNVECSHDKNVCVCIYGYKRGLKGDDCVPNLMDKSTGEACFDTSQCYYSLVCIDNYCGCYNGFKSVGDYQCVPREVYDSCTNLEDCAQTPNTICLNGVCACQASYKTVQYVSNSTGDIRMACIANSDEQALEGEECSYDVLKPVYCKSPFVCTSCGGDKYVCARRNLPLLANSAYTSCGLVSLVVPAMSAIGLVAML